MILLLFDLRCVILHIKQFYLITSTTLRVNTTLSTAKLDPTKDSIIPNCSTGCDMCFRDKDTEFDHLASKPVIPSYPKGQKHHHKKRALAHDPRSPLGGYAGGYVVGAGAPMGCKCLSDKPSACLEPDMSSDAGGGGGCGGGGGG